MLSYQHAFHAGNLADVHKHAILADVLAYLTSFFNLEESVDFSFFGVFLFKSNSTGPQIPKKQ